MTELERYENCRKERELITDFLSFVLRKHSCYLGNASGEKAEPLVPSKIRFWRARI